MELCQRLLLVLITSICLNAEPMIDTFIEKLLTNNYMSILFLSDFKTQYSKQVLSFLYTLPSDGIEVIKLNENIQSYHRRSCQEADCIGHKSGPGNRLVLILMAHSNLEKGLNYVNASVIDCPLRFSAGLFDMDNTVLFVSEEDMSESTLSIFQLRMMQIHKRAAILHQSKEHLVLQRYDVCNQTVQTLMKSSKSELENSGHLSFQMNALFPSNKMYGCKFRVSILPVGYILVADEVKNPR